MKIYAERNAKRPAAKHYQEDRCHQNENKVVRLKGGSHVSLHLTHKTR